MASILSVDSIWKLDAELHIIKHLSTIFRRQCVVHVNCFFGALETRIRGASKATGPCPDSCAADLVRSLLPIHKKFAIMAGYSAK